MTVETQRHEARGGFRGPLELLAEGVRRAAAGTGDAEAAAAVAEAAAGATDSGLAVVLWPAAGAGEVAVGAVGGRSGALAARLAGARTPASELPPAETTVLGELPPAVRDAAAAGGLSDALYVPAAGPATGGLVLLRRRPYGAEEMAIARIAAAQLESVLRDHQRVEAARPAPGSDVLRLAGDALTAGAVGELAPAGIARVAAEAAGARGAAVWRLTGSAPRLTGAHRLPPELLEPHLAELVARALGDGTALSMAEVDGATPASVTTVLSGSPPAAALQLVFPSGRRPSAARAAGLSAFALRVAQAIEAIEEAREAEDALRRTRALLGVLGHAISELSLAHTLDTAVEHASELLGAERIAVYLRRGATLETAASRGLAGPHAPVAERLLELALGPGRARGFLLVEDAARDPRLAPVRAAVTEAGIAGALALPLVAREEVIGLLAAYLPGRRRLPVVDENLLAALAGQLAVAVENARLHEQAKELVAERESALVAERESSRRLRALHEISASFAQSLSLEETLEAVGRAAVDALAVDAAVLRVPDARGAALVTQVVRVRDERLEAPLRAMLSQAQVLSREEIRRLFPPGEALLLDAPTAGRLGGSFALLGPFLERGSSAAVVSVAVPGEVLATLTILSLDPGRPIQAETLDAARAIAAHAALALENARLYEQQKQFTDAMQRALLPEEEPELEGFAIGVAYESSARMDVGGDLYDFLQVGERCLALVVGDVTGHGIEAAADMAMVKFVFRSLAREHHRPSDFLARANEVVAEEVQPGKFVTMLYLLADGEGGVVDCASAGHPPPRIVRAGGAVEELAVSGVALGIESGHAYAEARAELAPGDAIVVYTDGVIESRRDGEVYGVERLDEFLARSHELPPRELAAAVLDDCRRFARGELVDDCAVVAIRRSVQ